MKETIAFHLEGLKNSKEYALQESLKIERAKKALDRLQAQIIFESYQIDSAVAEGKDGFDSERYKIKERQRWA